MMPELVEIEPWVDFQKQGNSGRKLWERFVYSFRLCSAASSDDG